MPHRDYSVYKRGAKVLGPIVLVFAFYGGRACLRYNTIAASHEARVQEGELRAEVADLIADAKKQEELEQRAAEQAAAAPHVSEKRAGDWVTGQEDPEALVVDGKAVYWLNAAGGQVMTASREGGDVKVLAADQKLRLPRHAPTIAVDEKHVYWLTTGTKAAGFQDGTLSRVGKAGGAVEVLVEGLSYPVALQARRGKVYWFTTAMPSAPPAPPGPLAVLWSLPAKGGKPVQVAEAVSPCGLALDDSHAFWVDRAEDWGVWRAPLSGGKATQIVASETTLACSLAVDGSHLYWISKQDDAILRAKKDGKDSSVVAFEPQGLAALALDQTRVVSLSLKTPGMFGEAGSVWSVAKDGGGRPEAVVTDLPGLNSIAADAGKVYFTRWSEVDGEGVVATLP